MNNQKTTLIDTTLECIEINLIHSRADEKTVELYRLTVHDGCYFAARGDIDPEGFKRIERLRLGAIVRICAFEERGRRKIAWIRSIEYGIPPYDLLRQRQRNLTLLSVSFCLLAASLLGLGIHASLVTVLAILVAIISLFGCVVAVGGLIESLNSSRVEAQERWQSEPYRFVDEGSIR
ncbi:MAG TPA: hypothetical protein VGL01_04755 [Trinickia sp.]|uniref:hypothetical protein n=1 Tax=Trinickia sp. TaxID=2571163 RepID=UPI002F406A2D